jgi:hypothetical protein
VSQTPYSEAEISHRIRQALRGRLSQDEVLREAFDFIGDACRVIQWNLLQHSGACCSLRDGKIVVVEGRCKCDGLTKRKRELLGVDLPKDPEPGDEHPIWKT